MSKLQRLINYRLRGGAPVLFIVITFLGVKYFLTDESEDTGISQIKMPNHLSAFEEKLILEFSKGNVKQNDSNLVKYIRDHFIVSPSTKDYNLNNPKGDPYAGEYQYVRKILKGKRDGFFIESGANDGEFLSTTLLLEKDFNWSGLLVEPDLYEFEKLKTKNRKAWASNVCLSTTDKVEKVNFIHNKFSQGQGMVNAARPSMRNKHLAGLPSNDKGNMKLNPSLWEKMEATCVPLFTLLSAINVTEIDLFTLDVQGSEMEILKTIPFSEVFIKIFCIEYVLIPEKELRDFMREKSYIFVKNITFGMTYDYLFVHESISISDIKGLDLEPTQLN